MLKRLLTGVVILALTVGFFALRFVSPYFFDAYLMAITIFAVLEVGRALNKNDKKNDIFFVLPLPVIAYIALILCTNFELGILIFYGILFAEVALLLMITFLMNILSKNRINKEMVAIKYIGTYKQYVATKTMKNLFLLFYPSFLMIQFFVVNHLSGFSDFSKLVGLGIELLLLVMIFVTTIVTDTGAYLIGSGVGGPKLCPKISPKKTISGAIGAVLSAVVFALGLYFLLALWGYSGTFDTYNLKIWHFAIYGFVASILTQFGDIFASFVKRKNNLKDYGKILPGHGGVMDRIDGLMFNAIATLIFAIIVF